MISVSEEEHTQSTSPNYFIRHDDFRKKEILRESHPTMVKQKIRTNQKVKNRYTGWCPQASSKPWLERINADCISPRQFYHRYIKRRMPVVLTSSNTECLRGFSPESLAAIAGECRVAVEKGDPDSYQQFGRTDSSSRRIMRFSDFLKRMKEDELYCSTQPLPEDARGPTKITSPHVQRLIDRGMIPDNLPLMGNMQLYQINSWIGCSEDGTSSGYHHDFHDNFYFLISGEKQFRLASPHYTSEAPTFGCRRNKNVLVHPNGLISYIGDTVREDGARRVNVLRWKLKNAKLIEDAKLADALQNELEELLLDEAMVHETMNHSDPSPPSFCIEGTAQGEYITETLRAGEMLYLPASYFHEVISFNRETSPGESSHHMAVNYWYYPPSSKGSFETPYEDDFWAARWHKLDQDKSRRMRIPKERMGRNKQPIVFRFREESVRKFLRNHLERQKRI